MIYHSTRDKNNTYTSKEAILKGLCEDGGLFVSDDILNSKIDMEAVIKLSYNEIVFEVFKTLLPDYSDAELKDCIEHAYKGKFETDDIAPLTPIGENYLCELYHGPTCAFKDVALCMLPQLMAKANNGKKVMILTATSGDTGKAALAGFKDAENIGITVFYPHEKVSHTQYLQMATSEGGNVFVAAVRGNFDDCQTGVKQIFNEYTDKYEKEYGVFLSSANSINVGRLVPQIIYYIDSYKKLLEAGRISFGDEIDFCVPTGNFGDVLAGYYAKLLGLPVRKLIVASNENKVLFDFFESGVYDRNRDFILTSSPSMDILISSNLERLIYHIAGDDSDKTKELMESLTGKGVYEISDEMKDKLSEFYGAYSTEDETFDKIASLYDSCGYIIDTHTAVAANAYDSYVAETGDQKKNVIASTASPYKFLRAVLKSIDAKYDKMDDFELIDELNKLSGVDIPNAIEEIRTAPVRHTKVCEVSEMKQTVAQFLGM